MPNNLNPEQERLKKAVDELSALNQIASAINALMSVEEITQIIVDRCVKRVRATQGAVYLLEEEKEDIDRFKTFVREFSQSADKIPFHLNESLSGWMIKNKTILISNQADSDERFRGMNLGNLGIYSILAAPLLSRNKLIGSLAIFNKRDDGGFNDSDKRFIGIVGSQTAKVIENARLREQEQKLVKIQEERKVAQQIQRGFLPDKGVSLTSCEVCGFNSPAEEVGGDYYDIVTLKGGRLFLSLGDVSGHGVPAALQMACAQAVLRSQLLDTENVPLTKLAHSLNHLICQFTPPEQFITASFGVYNSNDKTFRYINAGHEPPIIVRKNGTIEPLTGADLILGVMPDYIYKEFSVMLDAGDFLFIYTDGVTEVFNEDDEEYGEKRLKEFLKNCVGLETSAIGAKMMAELNQFRGQGIQTDDITMLILRLF
jgi:sigma-B regulation protein RsbU (phosphoserine phosphatase)